MTPIRSAALLAALFLALPVANAQSPVDGPGRYQRCLDLVEDRPEQALGEADAWEVEGGGNLARHCAATAMVALGRAQEGARNLVDLAKELAEIDPALSARLAIQGGRAWREAGDAVEAKAAFGLALEVDPENREALTERGWTSAWAEDYVAAIEDFTAALRLAPGDPDLLRNRAAAHRFLGDYGPALRDIEQALAADPDNAGSYLERGNIRRLAGDLPGAKADWRRVIEIAPGTEAAAAADANLQRTGG